MRLRTGLVEACCLTTLLGLVGLCAFHPLYAVDFFWHLKLGEVIAHTGSIPETNLFSAAEPQRPYVQFNWLWELGAAAVVRNWGLHGMRVAQVLLMLMSFAGLYTLARRIGQHAPAALFMTALGLLWFEDRFQERPASLVLGFVVLLAPFLLGAYRAGWRPLVALGVLAVFWSNLHGGESVLLLLSFIALGAGEVVNRRLGRTDTHAARAFASLGICVVALLISPSFVRGVTSWLGTIGAQVDAGNEEWQPAYTMLAQGLRPSFVLIALGPTAVTLVWGLDQWRRFRRDGKSALDASEIFLCAGYLALAQHAVRNVFLSLVPLLFMLRRSAAQHPPAPQRAFALATFAMMAIVAEDALLYSYGSSDRVATLMRFDLGPDMFPELSTDMAREARLEGGIVNDGHWGGYLIWRLWPSCGVFADSRHHFTEEMWQVFRETHDALRRPAGLEQANRRYGTELVMFKGPTFPLGIPRNFRLLYKAGDQELFQDLRGRHARQNLERTQRWLVNQGLTVPNDPLAQEIPELARQLGAQRFLATPYSRLQIASAQHDLHDASAAVRGEAHRTLANLAYRTGDHAAAAREYERALRELPGDPVLRYQSAQNTFASGDHTRAQPLLQALLDTHEGLAPRQLHRVQAMLAVTRAP